MSIEEFTYQVKLSNDDHEQIELTCDLFGKEPRVQIEVPAFKDGGKVVQPRMYVNLTLPEFDELSRHVAKYRETLEGLKNV